MVEDLRKSNCRNSSRQLVVNILFSANFCIKRPSLFDLFFSPLKILVCFMEVLLESFRSLAEADLCA